MRLAVVRFGDPDGGGFFDRAKDAAPMGGLDVRRKPMQDSPTPGANSVAAIVLDHLYAFTGEKLYRDWAEKTLEAFIGLVPQYGLFAATYGLAALQRAPSRAGRRSPGLRAIRKLTELEKAAHEIYRFGKAVLRVTPEQIASASLAPALREHVARISPDATESPAGARLVSFRNHMLSPGSGSARSSPHCSLKSPLTSVPPAELKVDDNGN